MSTIVYSKRTCPYCDQAKLLLSLRNVEYTEVVVGEDMVTSEFVAMYPEQRSVPLIIMDGVKYGGYQQLREHFDGQ
jgi:glutaredoxin 3